LFYHRWRPKRCRYLTRNSSGNNRCAGAGGGESTMLPPTKLQDRLSARGTPSGTYGVVSKHQRLTGLITEPAMRPAAVDQNSRCTTSSSPARKFRERHRTVVVDLKHAVWSDCYCRQGLILRLRFVGRPAGYLYQAGTPQGEKGQQYNV